METAIWPPPHIGPLELVVAGGLEVAVVADVVGGELDVVVEQAVAPKAVRARSRTVNCLTWRIVGGRIQGFTPKPSPVANAVVPSGVRRSSVGQLTCIQLAAYY
jgi:hypothetical protein